MHQERKTLHPSSTLTGVSVQGKEISIVSFTPPVPEWEEHTLPARDTLQVSHGDIGKDFGDGGENRRFRHLS